ncbi:MAG: YbbR-like domain-containing protein [Deltaproteobacteria bacterium]|nr:YbbR-like domain-containing protein [Deltaproteobacteria bacterium]
MNDIRKYIFYIGILFVLVVGVGLFFFLEKVEDVVLPIPVKLENVPSDLVAVADVGILDVRVRGPVKLLDEIKGQDIHYTIDLSKGTPGLLPITVSKDSIHVPRKLSVVSVQPESLTINFEERLNKQVPIVADLCGAPSEGYVVSRVVVTPSVVELSGPYAVIDQLTAIRTTPIDVNGLTATIKKEVALAIKPELHVEAISKGIIDVEVVVEEKNVEKSFDIPVEGKNTPYRYVITPSNINISIKGPIKIIEELAASQEKLQVYVDLNGLKPGVYVRKTAINLPLDVVLVDAKPEVFTVKITE